MGVLGRAPSFFIRDPKTSGVPGGECGAASEIDYKISNGGTILSLPEILSQAVPLPASNQDMGRLTPTSPPTFPIPNFSFSLCLSGLPGASTTWRSSRVDKEAI